MFVGADDDEAWDLAERMAGRNPMVDRTQDTRSLRELAAADPGARLGFLPNTPQLVDAAAQVLTGIDLLLLPHGFVQDLPHHDLYRDEWVCLVAADNGEVGDELTVAQLETMPWVLCYSGPTASTPAARQMRTLGIEPHVHIITESFLTVPSLVAGTARVALLQRRLADRIPAGLGVRALPSPFQAGQLIEAMWWHPMYSDAPEHRYLRELVIRAGEIAGTAAYPLS